eukprot:1194464-Prorocentrum_minimum.AAC.2
MLSTLTRLAPAPGICSLPSRDWIPRRVYALYPAAIGSWGAPHLGVHALCAGGPGDDEAGVVAKARPLQRPPQPGRPPPGHVGERRVQPVQHPVVLQATTVIRVTVQRRRRPSRVTVRRGVTLWGGFPYLDLGGVDELAGVVAVQHHWHAAVRHGDGVHGVGKHWPQAGVASGVVHVEREHLHRCGGRRPAHRRLPDLARVHHLRGGQPRQARRNIPGVTTNRDEGRGSPSGAGAWPIWRMKTFTA